MTGTDQPDLTRDEMEAQWEDLVKQDRACRVFWGAAGCYLERGHDGGHIAPSGSTPDMGLMFGEDTTPEERADME